MPDNLNDDLLKQLNDKDSLLHEAPITNHELLLKDLLAVDPANVEAFRAVVAKQQFILGFKTAAKEWFTAQWKLPFSNVSESDFYSSNKFLDPNGKPNFKQIQQTAAKQLVKLKFNAKTDIDVLVSILGQNKEECRRYIAEKIASELNTSPGWTNPSVLAVENQPSDFILVDEAIVEIKQLAAAYRIQYALDGASLDELAALVKAKNIGKDDFFRSIEKDLKITLPSDSKDMDLVWEIISPKVIDRLNNDKMDKVTEFISTKLSDTDMDDLGAFVNAEDPNALVEHLKRIMGTYSSSEYEFDPSDDNLDSIRDQVRIRHLEHLLETTDVDTTEALAAVTPEELKSKLQDFFPEQAYIEHVAITDDNQEQLKYTIKCKLVYSSIYDKKIPNIDELQKIDEAGNLQALKDVFITIAAKSVPYITEEDVSDIKKAAREQRFRLQVENYSDLAPTFSPALVQLFQGFDETKQRSMLKDHANLPKILNAKELSEIKPYLKDIDVNVLTSILENNKSNALFRGVYNFEIAKVLRSIYPSIELTQQQVEDINTKLLDLKGSSLANDADYSKVVKEIEVLVGVSDANKELFYSAFGLDDEGVNFIAPADKLIRDNIKKQITNNEELAQAYKDTGTSLHLLRVLLQVEKKELPITTDEIKKVQALFKSSLNLSQFNERIGKEKSLIPDISAKQQFAFNRLTPSLFEVIKKDLEAKALAKGEPAALASVRKELQKIQQNNKDFDEYKKTVAFIPYVRDEYIYSPLFRNNAVYMRAKYTELSNQCEVVIEQLNHNKQKITDFLANLPADSTAKLRAELTVELDGINNRLDYFVGTTQSRLSGKDGILATIDHSFGFKAFTYQADGINTYIIKKVDLADQKFDPKKSGSTPGTVIDPSGTPNDAPVDPFILEQTPNKDEVRCFDVVYTASNKVETTGRFIHEIADKHAMTVTAKGERSVTKNNPGKFEVVQFPQKQPGDTDGKALIAARVNFAMVMATQALSTLDSPPTKDRPIVLRGKNEEELKYLWTALIILGEKNPRLKFGSDAVHVRSIEFNPASEKGTLWGYSGNSLYNTAFKEHQAHVELKTKDLAKHSENVFGSIDKRPEVSRASEFFKKELSSTKKEVDQRREKSAAKEPEGPKPSV